MSIRYIQFRHDIVVPVGGTHRSFNAWTPEKHGDFVEPEETPYGVTLHAIETVTTYDKGETKKVKKRTGRRWRVPSTSVGFITEEDDKVKAKTA